MYVPQVPAKNNDSIIDVDASTVNEDINTEIELIEGSIENIEDDEEEIESNEGNTENEDRDEDEEVITVADILKELEQYCVHKDLTSNQLFPTEKLPDVLKDNIRLIERIIGIDKLNPKNFIKALYSKKGYGGLRFPNLALVEGKPCFVWHDIVYDATEFLRTKTKFYAFEMSKLRDNFYYSLKVADFADPDCDTADLLMRVWTKEPYSVEHKPMNMRKSLQYLISVLEEYVFDVSSLGVGEYQISDVFVDTEKKQYRLLINKKWYRVYENHIEQIQELKKKNEPLILIIEGYKTFTNKDDEEIKWFSFYLKGFARAIKLVDALKEYYKNNGMEWKDDSGDLDVSIPLKGIVKCNDKNRSFDIQLDVGTPDAPKIINVIPNADMKREHNVGMFNLNTYEGMYLKFVKGNKIVENQVVKWSFSTKWVFPQGSVKHNPKFSKLEEFMAS